MTITIHDNNDENNNNHNNNNDNDNDDHNSNNNNININNIVLDTVHARTIGCSKVMHSIAFNNDTRHIYDKLGTTRGPRGKSDASSAFEAETQAGVVSSISTIIIIIIMYD